MPSRRAVLGSLFSSSLLMPGVLSELMAGEDPLAARSPHTGGRAKRIIMIYATGGVSHIDTFDPKPLAKGRDGTGSDKLMGNVFGAKPNARCGTEVYASDFLPAAHQGTRVIPGDNPIANLRSPGRSGDLQQAELDLVSRLNRQHFEARPHDSALAARIKSFETAFHMQQAAPEAFDVSSEPAHIRELYGLDRKVKGPGADFASQCLVARRLAERGVRFIELIDTGSRPNWDSHGEMKEHADLAYNVDQPTAALISDLKQRGMLDDTIVLWVTEFGRTPARTAGATIAIVSASGWRAAVSNPATSTAAPTTSANTPSRTRSKSTTSTPPSCTNSAWTTKN